MGDSIGLIFLQAYSSQHRIKKHVVINGSLKLSYANITAMQKFAEAYPECKTFDKPIFGGMTFGTMYAMMGSGPNQTNNLEWLNARTQYKYVSSRMPVMGMTALHGVGQNTEVDPRLVNFCVPAIATQKGNRHAWNASQQDFVDRFLEDV